MLRALIVIARLSAAGASGPRGGASRLGQQGLQGGGPGSVQPSASGHFDGLQVQAGVLLLCRKHYLEKRLDFPCDFLMNSSSRFFSASVQPAGSGSAGRQRQICSLTAVIGIGAAVARRPLPHHRAYGSVHGGLSRLR